MLLAREGVAVQVRLTVRPGGAGGRAGADAADAQVVLDVGGEPAVGRPRVGERTARTDQGAVASSRPVGPAPTISTALPRGEFIIR